MIKKYVKKPVVVEAYHLKDLSYTSVKECLEFMGQSVTMPTSPFMENKFVKDMFIVQEQNGVIIETLEGNHLARPDDYIIKGVHGEFYPCKPDIFHKTYSPYQPMPTSLTGEDAERFKEAMAESKINEDAFYKALDNMINGGFKDVTK